MIETMKFSLIFVLLVLFWGSRMRNYVSESPVTIQNNQAVIYLSGCFDKEENLYNKTY